MAVRDSDQVREKPTEADPRAGCAALRIDGKEIVLSEGVWWVDPEGDYVIQSLEFDVSAGASSFSEALSKFIDNVWEFGVYLSEFDDLAENEEQMFHRLASRLPSSRQLGSHLPSHA